MRPQGAVVAAAADAVARKQKTDIMKKRRSFLRLFSLVRLFRNQTLGIDTYFRSTPIRPRVARKRLSFCLRQTFGLTGEVGAYQSNDWLTKKFIRYNVGRSHRRLHMDHAAIGIQHGFMHHFGQCRMREDGVH